MANTKITNHIVDSTVITGQTAVTAADGDYLLVSDASDSGALKKVLASDLIQTSEEVADIVGAMVSSNTETGITVTYQDADNTIDFAIGTLNQDTTGTADNITVSANNSTDETVYPIFVDGATGSQGAESDTGLTYNPSSGVLTATQFTGNLTGNVTGNTSGTAATVTGAAQSNITSLGTLTTLTVDDITINGSTISDGGDMTIDVGGTIDLNSDGGQIKLSDAGTQVGLIQMDSGNNLIFRSMVSDEDVFIKGNDGGSTITALQLDMSEAGKAIFNSGAEFHGLLDNQISHSSTDVTAANSNATLRLGNSAAGNGIYNAIKFSANQQDMYIMSFNHGTQADRRMGFFLGSVAGDAVADERLSIRGDGKVGIGTTSPATQLQLLNAGESMIRMGYSTTQYGQIGRNSDGTYEFSCYENGGVLKFGTTTSNNATTERMRIDASGNLGIGTTSPAAKFSVDVGAPGSTDQTLGLFQSQDGRRIGFVWDDSTSTLGVATLTDHALTFHTNGNSSERMRLTSDGVAMGDTDGDYTHRGATGGLHVKRGGLLMNGPPGDANMSSGTNGNQWTYHGQGGRGGSFTSLTISVPNPNNGASGVGYGGFSLEFYIAGYNAKYHSGHFSGYVNASITLSKRAFWDSSGSGTLSSGSVGAQGFYLTIGFPSMTHPTCKFVINKGGHGGSAGNAAWTDMDGVSVTWG